MISITGLKLLIVDDEISTREGLTKHIPWIECNIAEVKSAANGIEALQLLKEFVPDIIISDIKMPKMNGLEFIAEARELSSTARVVFLSAYASKENLLQSFDLGVVKFIEKPINRQELLAAIKKIALQIENEVSRLSPNASDTINNNKLNDYGYISTLIINYINANYSSSELSIVTISDAIYMSSTYICYVFKKRTQMTINTYITQVRIEKAKELLSDISIKISVVAEMVGYTSVDYFTKLFKKCTNMTPSEYRDKTLSLLNCPVKA